MLLSNCLRLTSAAFISCRRNIGRVETMAVHEHSDTRRPSQITMSDTSVAVEHYEALYRKNLDLEAKWLEICAHHKADSVQVLLRRAVEQPESVLEIGAGTGAVI